MGGYGSGGWEWHVRRQTTLDFESFRMTEIRVRFDLKPGFALRLAGEVVRLDWTRCNYGGKRPWFLCPECNRRAAVLYLELRQLRCRKCLDLAYPSQNESNWSRMLAKSQRIRKELGGSGDAFDPFPSKPFGMRWRKYRRLKREATVAEDRSRFILRRRLRQM